MFPLSLPLTFIQSYPEVFSDNHIILYCHLCAGRHTALGYLDQNRDLAVNVCSELGTYNVASAQLSYEWVGFSIMNIKLLEHISKLIAADGGDAYIVNCL